MLNKQYPASGINQTGWQKSRSTTDSLTMTSSTASTIARLALGLAVALVVTEATIGTGNDVMTNQWHVHLNGNLGKEAAMEVAKRNGFSYVGSVSDLIVMLRCL